MSENDPNKQHLLRISIIGPGMMPIPPSGWGAVEILIWDYACALRAMGHAVDVVNTKDRSAALDQVRAFKPDFVHIQYDDYADWCADYSSLAGAVAITSHYGYLTQRDKWGYYADIFTRCTAHAQENVYHFALSEAIARVYEEFGVARTKIRVTPNGANHHLFRFAATAKFADRTSCVGKVERRKGQYLLQHNPSVWFAGNQCDGAFNYRNNRWLGEWTKESLYQNLTDYANLALLSDGEADPLVVKEALVAGLGVVVSECAAANIDCSLKFITVIPMSRLSDRDFVDTAIAQNRRDSAAMRESIREYSKAFWWQTLVSDYAKCVASISEK